MDRYIGHKRGTSKNNGVVCGYLYNIYVASSSSSTTYSKGSTQYSDVISTNSSTYPSNGKADDGYWYVYKGLK